MIDSLHSARHPVVPKEALKLNIMVQMLQQFYIHKSLFHVHQ